MMASACRGAPGRLILADMRRRRASRGHGLPDAPL